jgi:1-aminocyclopropane-1-carboxylate deaminase/D-cysteine desulfhydrase-like pyridoxal-dependent ACC family enzyme
VAAFRPETSFPTPLRRLSELSHAGAELWLKDDGVTHSSYGGNKVRKLAAIVRAAEAGGARRLVTFGAAGSHHVLTTALFARAAGLACAAVLTPQPASEHAVDTLRAALHAGLEAYAAPTPLELPLALARALRRGDVVVPPGGSNVLGASQYADAVRELRDQLGELGAPPPDYIVVPLGTGGTAAGILAGTSLHGLASTVVAVSILKNPASRWLVQRLARAILGTRLGDANLALPSWRLEPGFVGRGYGFRTPEGDGATVRLHELGLELDPTYTAKSMACVLRLLSGLHERANSRPVRILYWHTLSTRPLEPLLAGAPSFAALPPGLTRLLK